MVFKKNKRYYSALREETDGNWVCDNPLFMCGDKGLFPIYRENGRYGILNKNYHELVFKTIPKEIIEAINYKAKPNKTTKNVLKFKGEDDELFKGL
tara:strand:- start:14215 stop:14502 length:288 start_codon:yes stop_codon:yes gene_type:complete